MELYRHKTSPRNFQQWLWLCTAWSAALWELPGIALTFAGKVLLLAANPGDDADTSGCYLRPTGRALLWRKKRSRGRSWREPVCSPVAHKISRYGTDAATTQNTCRFALRTRELAELAIRMQVCGEQSEDESRRWCFCFCLAMSCRNRRSQLVWIGRSQRCNGTSQSSLTPDEMKSRR